MVYNSQQSRKKEKKEKKKNTRPVSLAPAGGFRIRVQPVNRPGWPPPLIVVHTITHATHTHTHTHTKTGKKKDIPFSLLLSSILRCYHGPLNVFFVFFLPLPFFGSSDVVGLYFYLSTYLLKFLFFFIYISFHFILSFYLCDLPRDSTGSTVLPDSQALPDRAKATSKNKKAKDKKNN